MTFIRGSQSTSSSSINAHQFPTTLIITFLSVFEEPELRVVFDSLASPPSTRPPRLAALASRVFTDGRRRILMKWNEESVKRGDGGGRSEEGSSPGECVNHAGVAYQDCAGCGSQTDGDGVVAKRVRVWKPP